jgi:molybdate-binding protein
MRHVQYHKTRYPGYSICDMVTYLQVSDDVAGRVASGALAAGEALPSVREAARRYGTTTTTVARAYRSLADAGVIDVADRRRSRVAVGGAAAATRLLGGVPDGGSGAHAVLRLAGSDDPALDIVLRFAGPGQVVSVGARGSFHGLTGIWRGTADAAAIHLRHRSGTSNSPFARTLLRGRRPAVIHLWRREQGLLTPEGNPGRVAGVAQLRGLRVVRRQFGTGTRVLLDRLLTEAGVAPASVAGPEAASHLEVAMAIASGQADAGLGVRAAATALDLNFTPVTWENFEIVLSADALGAAEPLIAALRDPAVRSAVNSLGGYNLSRAAHVQLLD